MEKHEKDYIKFKLASWLRKILKDKKEIGINNKNRGVEDISLVESMRQLEAASGLSYTIIHSTSVGKRDIQFTTLITLLDSLKISFSEFAIQYDKITDKEIKRVIEEIELRKKPFSKKNKNKTKKSS